MSAAAGGRMDAFVKVGSMNESHSYSVLASHRDALSVLDGGNVEVLDAIAASAPYLDDDGNARVKIVLPYVGGEHSTWTESGGGAEDDWTAPDVAAVLRSMYEVDASQFGDMVGYIRSEAAEDSAETLAVARGCGMLTEQQHDVLLRLTRSAADGGRQMLCVPDFYPRNLVRRPSGTFVLVDWDTFDGASVLPAVAPVAYFAGYYAGHMWNAPRWRAQFADEVCSGSFGHVEREALDKYTADTCLKLVRLWLSQGYSPGSQRIADQGVQLRSIARTYQGRSIVARSSQQD